MPGSHDPISCKSFTFKVIHATFCLGVSFLLILGLHVYSLLIHMRVSINEGTPKWIVYSGKSY